MHKPDTNSQTTPVTNPADDATRPRRSYNIYTVRTSFNIAAHSEEQALRRFDTFMSFLADLNGRYEYPHDAVHFIQDYGYAESIELEGEYIDDDNLGASMLSNMEFMYDWYAPDAGADDDPEALFERCIFGVVEE